MSSGRAITVLNLGGEGETADVINQQRPAALAPQWGACRTGETLEQLARQGIWFLICSNSRLPIATDSIDLVITNSVPIDSQMFGEPTIQSSEIRRILISQGQWIHDGIIRWTKP